MAAVEFENRVDTMAQTEDYAKRGLELPYGYRKEMRMMRLWRWKSRKDLKAKISQWFDRARDSGKSVSPREAAFVRECNIMVVVRADRSMQIRERKHRKLERAVYEHDNDDGEESKLMLHNNELGVRGAQSEFPAVTMRFSSSMKIGWVNIMRRVGCKSRDTLISRPREITVSRERLKQFHSF